MKSRYFLIALAAASALATPALAQSRADQERFDQASQRFDAEVQNFQRERDRYLSSQRRGGYRANYGNPANGAGYRDEFATDYDATRYYRDDPRYRERRLTAADEVYRGSDGRYYCRRSDGTTGLIVGGVAGGVLGNVVDGGGNRVAGTLIGGTLGALLGRSIDQNTDVRCR